MLPLTKRQREILDYLNEFIQQHGYAPSLEEIGRRFNLSSLATVHKHLTNLQEKGFIRRAWNRSRSVELVPTRAGGRAVELPLLGFVAAGAPIEAVASNETIAVPETLVGKRDSYVLRVKGDSMIDEQIRDGDFVIVEDRKSADNGEMVIALVGGLDVTLKKFYRENGRVRLQPANPAMQPMMFDPDAVQVQGVVVGVMRKYEEVEEVEKWKKWKSKFKVLFVLSSLSLLACRPAEQDTGLPTGWRLPTPEELAAEPIRAESPTRDARASADFNGDGIQDEALLVVSTNALREGLIVRLSCGDACAQWITLDTR
jgi:repressor LexA